MIKFEDAELEEFVISGESDVAVPIEICCGKGGTEPIFTLYSEIYPALSQAIEKHIDAPFAPDAVSEFSKIVIPIVNEWGYKLDSRGLFVTREYSMSKFDGSLCRYILDGCRLISSSEEIADMTIELLHKPDPDPDDEDDVCAVMIADGKVVAEASINDYADEENALEINVECAVNCRKRGYGASCVAALAEYLISRGYKVNYKCRSDNAASIAVAQKLGFDFEGERISFVCYSFDERQNP